MNLFLEGLSGSGKSTLLRECLFPYKTQIGGFSSQRLWQENYASYRIQPADCFDLTADYTPDMEHVFRYHYKDTTVNSLEVFESYGVELLRDAAGYPLILLDEIGGSELLVPEFRENLYNLIKGPYNCIGVLKLSEKARYMGNSTGQAKDFGASNEELRELITSLPDSKILYFERENRDKIKNEINAFIDSIFIAR